jgi:hypothetical protein
MKKPRAALTRREILTLGAGALPALAVPGCGRHAADADDGWRRGDVRHVLPTVSHRSIALKLSLRRPLDAAPRLEVGSREVPGVRLDRDGRFWSFRTGGLDPATRYELRLRDARGEALCDAWPLRTFPSPEARPERMRAISYTCAGGPNLPIPPSWFHSHKPAAWRQQLFARMAALEPDFVVANGDHVYMDLSAFERMQESVLASLLASVLPGIPGEFDRSRPILGTENEARLTTVGDDQIADVYGVRFRSTPVFFITDDHDYFENDDATPEIVTFPPDAFHLELRNALQHLYFPEIPVETDPGHDIPGWPRHGRAGDGGSPVSTHFGEIVFGDLFRGLLYDCGGYLSLGDDAGLVPPGVEAWLVDRTRDEDTRHLVHFPSHPMGWTAGKWREWYPDHLESTGSIVATVSKDAQGRKYLWQDGWWAQHQRLVEALASQERRPALTVSGDLHALGAVRIERSGDLDLTANPVHSVLSGPVGTADIGWPSRARGVQTRTPEALIVRALQVLDERNGFTVLDVDRDHCRIEVQGCGPGYVPPEALRPEPAFALRLARRS